MNKETIRKKVAESYAAIVGRAEGGCCGDVQPKGVAARLSGYGDQELQDLPDDAVVNSFGCGNPVAMSGLTAGQTVLDLGSGAGIDLILAAQKVGPQGRVIGIDMTETMIDKARENVRAAGLSNVEVRQGIIEELPVQSGTVDWVISNCVINLSPEKHRVFAEIARVLKPGGQMLVSDIIVEGLPDELRDNEFLYSSCIAGAVSEREYLDGLRAAGLTDVEVGERLVYDTAQVEAFAASEELGRLAAGDGEGADAPDLLPLARSLVGKIWSARISARKPL